MADQGGTTFGRLREAVAPDEESASPARAEPTSGAASDQSGLTPAFAELATMDPSDRGAPAPAQQRPSARRPRADHQRITTVLDALAGATHEFDFFQALRRLECAYRDKPRFGKAQRAADEPIRLGQEPSLAFAPSPLARLATSSNGPPWLMVLFFGLLGPNGPLPLHLTEYVRDRTRNADDPTMARFFDVFHHRMLMLFYRAWANGEPTVEHDRPEDDRFATYAAALAGLAGPAFEDRDAFPDSAKLYYIGRLASPVRNAEGLQAMISDFFGMPAQVEEFMGAWLDLPPEYQWRLGRAPRGILGASTILGGRVWGCQQKFRVVLGPLSRPQFERMLPGGKDLPALTALVRNYAGDELLWDLRLVLEKRTDEKLKLGRSRMGWTTWLGQAPSGWREDLVLDPQSEGANMAA